QKRVHDVVIEFASRQSQPLLDRYVLQCENIPDDTLKTLWRNTTKVAAWEYPIYARWLAAIHDVNRALPRERRMRVIAGDTAIDWPRMHRSSDWAALGNNNRSFAQVIGDLVDRRHRALVVLGSNHLTRGGDRNRGPNTTTLVESRAPGS